MKWFHAQITWLHLFIARRTILSLLVVMTVVAYFGGVFYWYGLYIIQTQPPIWAWLFIPDCPLWGLLGGLGLMMVAAHQHWSIDARTQTQRIQIDIGVLFTLLWLVTYLPNLPSGFINQRAMLAMVGWTLLLFGIFFQQQPNWLLVITLFGNIKYGLWTVTAWLVFWRNTALVFGAPLFTSDSVFMTITHLGMIAMGFVLLTYFRPSRIAIICGFVWFAFSDFVDYGLGWYPPIPDIIPLSVMQWNTILFTIIFTFVLFGLSELSLLSWSTSSDNRQGLS